MLICLAEYTSVALTSSIDERSQIAANMLQSGFKRNIAHTGCRVYKIGGDGKVALRHRADGTVSSDGTTGRAGAGSERVPLQYAIQSWKTKGETVDMQFFRPSA